MKRRERMLSVHSERLRQIEEARKRDGERGRDERGRNERDF